MQSDWKQVYRITSERTGNSEQMYKDLGNLVFAKLGETLRKPKSLITKVKGIGSWYLRKKRMSIVVNQFPPNFDKNPAEFSASGFLKHENKIELYNLFSERLKEYDEYISIRDEKRKKRYETEKLLEPFNRED